MQAGLARIEITPAGPIRMEGMLRAHDSTGVHDPIFAKALVLSGGPQASDAWAVVSLDVCVMSGDNYLITPDYPGKAEVLLEEKYGGLAVFVNGAQGTMDIDGLRDRDWAGVERVGRALAEAVAGALAAVAPRAAIRLRSAVCHYAVLARKISDAEKTWAETIIKQTGGAVKPVADGVGDDYKANLFMQLWKEQDRVFDLEQICIAMDDCAFITFPGELFTEIGQRIKLASPFRHTYIIGLANGCLGYIPTRECIPQGGYEPLTRTMDDNAAEIIVDQSMALLRRVHALA